MYNKSLSSEFSEDVHVPPVTRMTFPDKSGMSLSGAQLFTMRNDLGQLALTKIQMRMGELEPAESSADVGIGIGDVRGDKMLSLKMKHKPRLRGSCERDHFLCQFVLQSLAAFLLWLFEYTLMPFIPASLSIPRTMVGASNCPVLGFSIIKTYARCESRQRMKRIGQFSIPYFEMIRMC
jgi:hypothetical protein